MSMFYELVGKLLENSGEALISPAADDSIDDEKGGARSAKLRS